MIKFQRQYVGGDVHHVTPDGRFTVEPVAWAPGNLSRPVAYRIEDACKPKNRYEVSRLAEARDRIQQILDREESTP